MSRGHGELGLKDYLRTFSDLVDDTVASRRAFLEFSPGVEATNWAPHSGSIFKTIVMQIHDSIVRDIMGVQSSVGQCTRVETVAEMTAGTFAVVDIETAKVAPEYWDQEGLSWDQAGLDWDSYSTADYPPLELYVWLPGGTDPRTITVAALLGFYFAGRGEVHPHLGSNKLVAGEWEALTGSTEADSGAGFSTALDTVLFKFGLASLKLVSTGAATGYASRYEDRTTVAGRMYRLSGHYQTPAVSHSSNLAVRLLVGNTGGTTILYEDGRDGDANGAAELRPTWGEWRRWHFDFLAPAGTTRIQYQLRAASSAGAGQVNFDRCKLQRIYRWNYYEPRLDSASLPEMQVASQSVFFGGKTVGLGNVGLANGDGALDAIFGSLHLSNKPMRLYVGGALGDGQEVYRDDWRAAWPGVSRKPGWSDQRWTFDVDDERALFANRTLPGRVYKTDEFPSVEQGQIGKARPLLFGVLAVDNYIRPTRIDKTAQGYGVYEVVDNSDWPYSDDAFPSNFRSEDEARRVGQESSGAILSTGPAPEDVSYDASLVRFSIIKDCKPMQQGSTVGSLKPEDILPIDFSIGGSELVATVFFQGKPREVAASLAAEMTAAAGATINVAYDETTHHMTISKASGTLILRTGTGANRQNKAWERLGYKTGADKTGALSYTADETLFDDVDADHHWRSRMNALRDDAVGTITGTASLLMVMQTDLAKLIFHAYLGWPLANIDAASFAAARAAEPWKVGTASPLAGFNASLYLDEETPISEVLARIERAALADIVLDGDGVVYFHSALVTSAPVRDFGESDFLTFEMAPDPSNVFRAVRVLYDYDPHRGKYRVAEVENRAAPTLHGRNEVLNLETSLFDYDAADGIVGGTPGNAPQLARRHAKLAEAPLRRAVWTTRGKAVDLLIGNKVRLTRTRGLDPTGALDAVEFRLVGLRHNFLTGVSRCEAVEAIDLAAVT